MIALLAAGIGAGITAAWYLRRPGEPVRKARRQSGHAAAFREGETDAENLQQTRHASPGSMRDDARRIWRAVDEASDASLPASDPPLFFAGTA